MNAKLRAGVLAACIAAAAGFASAVRADPPPPTRYPVSEQNFDLWCQEQQGLPPERCDKRLPQDDAAFKTYVDSISRYEVDYLKARQREADINRDILHDDPLDNPSTPGSTGGSTSTAIPGNAPPH